MNKEQTAKILCIIAIDFPKEISASETILFQMRVNLWHDAFKNYEFEEVQRAATEALKKAHFCPKLGDVFAELKRARAALLPSATNQWASIERTLYMAGNLIPQFGYTFKEDGEQTQGEQARNSARKLFEELSEEAKTYFGNYSTFLNVAQYETLEFEKARFLRMYDELAERVNICAEENARTSMLDILTRIENAYQAKQAIAAADKEEDKK